MSFAFNRLADPAYVASLKQDESSFVYGRTVWPGTTQPVVTVAGSTGSYPLSGATVTISRLTDVARKGDVFLFSGGHSLTITTAINATSTTATQLTGVVTGAIAVDEKLILHENNQLRFLKTPSDSMVKRNEQIDFVVQSNYKADIHNIWSGGIEYFWHWSSNLLLYKQGGPYSASAGKILKATDARNGQSYEASSSSSDIWNMFSPASRTTVLQLRNFGAAFDFGFDKNFQDRSGGYWWVEVVLYDNSLNVRYRLNSPMWFLEIAD